MSLLRIISAEKASFAVCRLCEVLDVNRSSFYAWERRPPSDRALSDVWLTEQINEIWESNRKVYGARRVHAELRMARGVRVSNKTKDRSTCRSRRTGRPRRRHRRLHRFPRRLL